MLASQHSADTENAIESCFINFVEETRELNGLQGIHKFHCRSTKYRYVKIYYIENCFHTKIICDESFLPKSVEK